MRGPSSNFTCLQIQYRQIGMFLLGTVDGCDFSSTSRIGVM